jgi:hypothetical protein
MVGPVGSTNKQSLVVGLGSLARKQHASVVLLTLTTYDEQPAYFPPILCFVQLKKAAPNCPPGIL